MTVYCGLFHSLNIVLNSILNIHIYLINILRGLIIIINNIESVQRALQVLALEWESIFTLELNAAKSTNYIEQCFKQKLRRIKFPTKNSGEA